MKKTELSPRGPSQETRRIALYKRHGFFTNDTRGAVIKRATNAEELERTFKLVYQNYIGQGFIKPNSSGLRIRPCDTSSDSAFYIAKYKDEVIGVSGLVQDSDDLGLPSDRIYKDELDTLRNDSGVVFEATVQIITPAFRNTGVLTELQRCILIQSIDGGCTDLVATVSTSQKSYYELIGFEQIGPVRNYTTGAKDLVVLMRLRAQELDEGLFAREETGSFWKQYSVEDNPYRQQIWQWSRQLKATFNNHQAISELFAKCPTLLTTATPDEYEAIKRRLGADAFSLLAEMHCPEAQSA